MHNVTKQLHFSSNLARISFIMDYKNIKSTKTVKEYY